MGRKGSSTGGKTSQNRRKETYQNFAGSPSRMTNKDAELSLQIHIPLRAQQNFAPFIGLSLPGKSRGRQGNHVLTCSPIFVALAINISLSSVCDVVSMMPRRCECRVTFVASSLQIALRAWMQPQHSTEAKISAMHTVHGYTWPRNQRCSSPSYSGDISSPHVSAGGLATPGLGIGVNQTRVLPNGRTPKEMPTPSISKPRRNPRRRCRSAPKPPPPPPAQQRIDSLPTCAIENIVRFLSEKPKLKGWSSHLKAEQLDALLRYSDNVSAIVRELFPSINYSWSGYQPPDTAGPWAVGNRKDIGHLMTELPARLGEHVRRLYVNTALTSPFAKAISAHCTGLRHLQFHAYYYGNFPTANFCAIIAARGSALESLQVIAGGLNERTIATIAAHCRGLTLLDLQMRGSCPALLSPIWRSVGGRLEHLKLYIHPKAVGFDGARLALSDLNSHCPNIARLAVDIAGSGDLSAIGDACAFYGSRLLELDIGFMSLSKQCLQRIFRACPNVAVSLSEYRRDCTEVAVTLGRFAAEWRPFFRQEPLDLECARVGKACPDLKISAIIERHRVVSEADVRSFFAYPKPKLTEFELSVRDVVSSGAVLKVLCESGCSLEIFKYDGPAPPIEVWRRFLKSQKRLKTVHIMTLEDCREFRWDEIVRGAVANSNVREVFCRCTGVHKSWCRAEPAMAEVRSSVRTKATSISVYSSAPLSSW